MLRFLFDGFGGQTLADDIAPDNMRARQVFITVGFEHDASRADALTSMGGNGVLWVGIMDKSLFEKPYRR